MAPYVINWGIRSSENFYLKYLEAVPEMRASNFYGSLPWHPLCGTARQSLISLTQSLRHLRASANVVVRGFGRC